MSDKRPTIAELIDYEMLLLDEETPPTEAVLTRDRVIREHLAPGISQRWQVLHAWMTVLKQADGRRLPGRACETYLTYAHLATLAAALMAGTGVARMILHSGTESKIDIFHWLLIFGLLPLVLTVVGGAVVLLSLIGRSRPSANASWQGPLARIMGDRFLSLLQRHAPRALAKSWIMTLGRIRKLYLPLLRAQAFQLLQVFGIGFYGGALVYLLIRAMFTYMTFEWGTTVVNDMGFIRSLIHISALPYAWLVGAPSDNLITATRIGALAATDSITSGSVDSRTWWTFLAASLVTYGLLPRVLMLVAGNLAVRHYLAGLTFDDHASVSLARRLARESDGTLTDHSVSRSITLFWKRRTAPVPAKPRVPCIIVSWRDVPMTRDEITMHVALPYHLAPTSVLAISGTATDRSALQTALSGPEAPQLMVVILDHWERPNPALSKVIAAMRSVVNDRLTILYAPIVEDPLPRLNRPSELLPWQSVIQQQGDPHSGLLSDYGGRYA
jgi:hypothetical protein